MPTRLSVLALSILTLLVIGTAPAPSSANGPLTVTKTADTADGSCDSDCSLREAIIAANAAPGPDIITLFTGTYNLTLAGAGEDAAATGDLDILDDLTINGAGLDLTIVDGNSIDRVFDIPGDFQSPYRNVTLRNMTVRNGNATQGGGGARSNFSSLTLEGVAITGNAAAWGGGIESVGGGAQLTLSASSVSQNTVTGPSGGGGIFNNTGRLDISFSTFNGNSGRAGGGIFNAGGILNITNSTFSGNTADDGGGGIRTNNDTTLLNVTITGNEADADGDGAGDGGGLWEHITGFDPTINVKNTIIAGNSDAGGQAPDCSGTIDSQGYNLIQETAGCTIAGDVTGNITGQDPLLAPLADNGGLTLTHALPETSPAVDAGSPDCPPPDMDQRGVSRPQGAACDIGAYELAFPLTQGDVDCSGEVNSVDALKVLRHVAGLSVSKPPTCPDIGSDVASLWGDVDCDNAVNAVDALKILRYVAGLTVQQTGECPDIGTGLPLSN